MRSPPAKAARVSKPALSKSMSVDTGLEPALMEDDYIEIDPIYTDPQEEPTTAPHGK